MASCTAAEPIKVMSFNIRYDSGAPSSADDRWISTVGANRRDLATTVINDFAPDILGVQEALYNQVADLQAALPDHGFYGVGREDGRNSGEFSGIYYRADRFTRVDQGTFWLTTTPASVSKYPGTCCYRIASWAILADATAGGQEYFVLNTHWDHQVQAAREFAAALIRDQLDTLAGDRPLIVMGDLNANENNAAYRELVGVNDPGGLQLLDSYREVVPVRTALEASFHGFTGGTYGSRIDFVLHSDAFVAEDATIVRTSFDGSYPSDHFPVTATLRLVPEPGSLGCALLTLTGALVTRRRRRVPRG
ncbi:MAG: endonuclease/exonuclease/phosphatase family protein [Planctomycetales bacterium]|nr:endonuclease/exonuclease/phosphatase family protein [Planctomycetales bacterium]